MGTNPLAEDDREADDNQQGTFEQYTREQGAHRAGRFAVGIGQPGMHGEDAGLGAKADHNEDKGQFQQGGIERAGVFDDFGPQDGCTRLLHEVHGV